MPLAQIDRKWQAQYSDTSVCDACGKLHNGRDTDKTHTVREVYLDSKFAGLIPFSICDRHRNLPQSIQRAYRERFGKSCGPVKLVRSTK
jgi:hypothetical protein